MTVNVLSVILFYVVSPLRINTIYRFSLLRLNWRGIQGDYLFLSLMQEQNVHKSSIVILLLAGLLACAEQDKPKTSGQSSSAGQASLI